MGKRDEGELAELGLGRLLALFELGVLEGGLLILEGMLVGEVSL